MSWREQGNAAHCTARPQQSPMSANSNPSHSDKNMFGHCKESLQECAAHANAIAPSTGCIARVTHRQPYPSSFKRTLSAAIEDLARLATPTGARTAFQGYGQKPAFTVRRLSIPNSLFPIPYCAPNCARSAAQSARKPPLLRDTASHKKRPASSPSGQPLQRLSATSPVAVIATTGWRSR